MDTSMTPVAVNRNCSDTPPTDLHKIEVFLQRYPGMSRDFMLEQIRRNRLCAYKVGGRWFISESDFAAYIAAGRNI